MTYAAALRDLQGLLLLASFALLVILLSLLIVANQSFHLFSVTMPVCGCSRGWFLPPGLPWIPPLGTLCLVPHEPLRHQLLSSSLAMSLNVTFKLLIFSYHVPKRFGVQYPSGHKRIWVVAFQDKGTKKLVSESPGLVDFAVGLVDFTLNLSKGKVKVWGNFFFKDIRASWKIEPLYTLRMQRKWIFQIALLSKWIESSCANLKTFPK